MQIKMQNDSDQKMKMIRNAKANENADEYEHTNAEENENDPEMRTKVLIAIIIIFDGKKLCQFHSLILSLGINFPILIKLSFYSWNPIDFEIRLGHMRLPIQGVH
jgi:hypothetical protein